MPELIKEMEFVGEIDMAKEIEFIHSLRGKGRPQILLIGNGVERAYGSVGWDILEHAKILPHPLDTGFMIESRGDYYVTQ